MTRIVHFSLIVVSVIVSGILAAQPQPVGEEFQVNSYDFNHSFAPTVAIAPDGSFTVAWQFLSEDIQARRFLPDATPIGQDFLVNTFTTSTQARARIVMNSNGEAAVLWQSGQSSSPGPDGFGESIQSQLFESDGSPRGSEFQVNMVSDYGQTIPRAAAATDGTFIAVWESDFLGDTFTQIIKGRRWAFNGSEIGNEFRVDSSTATTMRLPTVAVSNTNGSFLVAWHKFGANGTDNSGASVWGRLFLADGTPVDDDFQINTATTNNQLAPEVAAAPDGGFVVAWLSEDGGADDPDGFGIRAKRFDDLGNEVGGEFQVNESTSGDQFQPALAFLPGGELLTVWVDGVVDFFSQGFTIEGQLFAASGQRLRGEFQIASSGTNVLYPAVAAHSEGVFVVAWQDSKSTFDTDIQGRLFLFMPLFIDDFESGDTSKWSNVVP